MTNDVGTIEDESAVDAGFVPSGKVSECVNAGVEGSSPSLTTKINGL
jgi:hypothetical protein